MDREWPKGNANLFSFGNLSRFKRVGVGAFGSVYKATMEGFQEPVAVKVLTAEENFAVDIFYREATILKSLGHK